DFRHLHDDDLRCRRLPAAQAELPAGAAGSGCRAGCACGRLVPSGDAVLVRRRVDLLLQLPGGRHYRPVDHPADSAGAAGRTGENAQQAGYCLTAEPRSRHRIPANERPSTEGRFFWWERGAASTRLTMECEVAGGTIGESSRRHWRGRRLGGCRSGSEAMELVAGPSAAEKRSGDRVLLFEPRQSFGRQVEIGRQRLVRNAPYEIPMLT